MNQLSRQFLGAFRRLKCRAARPPACRLQSVHRTVASRSHIMEVAHFSFSSIISGVLDRFATCAGFFEAARLMPWLMKMLDHHTLGASPGTTSVNDFFRKRDRLKRSRARTSIKSM